MSSSALAGMTDRSLSARWQRRRRILIPVIAVLLAIGAFLQWGPIGLGAGPLALQMDATQGQVERSQAPVAFTIPLYNSGHGLAVIDELKLIGGTRYAGPRLLRLAVLTTALRGGAWPARAAGTTSSSPAAAAPTAAPSSAGPSASPSLVLSQPASPQQPRWPRRHQEPAGS